MVFNINLYEQFAFSSMIEIFFVYLKLLLQYGII
jgi:hypothetical protein